MRRERSHSDNKLRSAQRMKDKADAGNSLVFQRLSAPPLIKASIPAGDQLVPVIGASSSLSASLPQSGASDDIPCTRRGQSRKFHNHRWFAPRTHTTSAIPSTGARQPWNVDNNSGRRNAPLPPAVHSPHFTEVKNRPQPEASPPDLVFLELAPWAVRRTIPSLRCTHKWA